MKRRKSIPRLKGIDLPYAGLNKAYQIIAVGKIRKFAYKNPWKVQVFFRSRYLTGPKLLFGELYEKWISILDSPLLKVGSLWDCEGTQVDLSTNVYCLQQEFSIPNRNGSVLNLNEIFPGFKFVKNLIDEKYWDRVCEIPYYKFKLSNNKYVIIPCFELLRFLAYRGEECFNYLFTNQNNTIHDICRKKEGRFINKWEVDVEFKFNACGEPDIRILTELLLSPGLDNALKNAHNVFLAGIENNRLNRSELTSFIKFNPDTIDRPLMINACGINVEYGYSEYFMVSSINRVSNLFSYDKLHFSFTIDNREVSPSNEPDKNDLIENETLRNIIVPQVDPLKPISIDSSEEADSGKLRAKLDFENDDEYNLPELIPNSKLLKKTSTDGKHIIYEKIADPQFSTTLGGSDKNVVGMTADYDSENKKESYNKEKKQLGDLYFDIIQKFTEKFPKNVTLCTFNNKEPGAQIAIFRNIKGLNKPFFLLHDEPRQVGIIQIHLESKYFYYVIIMGALKRAGFIYKSNYEKFTEDEFNELILNQIADYNGNWSSFKAEKMKVNNYQRVKQDKHFYLVIISRNQDSTSKVINCCNNDMKKSNRFS